MYMQTYHFYLICFLTINKRFYSGTSTIELNFSMTATLKVTKKTSIKALRSRWRLNIRLMFLLRLKNLVSNSMACKAIPFSQNLIVNSSWEFLMIFNAMNQCKVVRWQVRKPKNCYQISISHLKDRAPIWPTQMTAKKPHKATLKPLNSQAPY